MTMREIIIQKVTQFDCTNNISLLHISNIDLSYWDKKNFRQTNMPRKSFFITLWIGLGFLQRAIFQAPHKV
jgi:hypothetical protein